MLMRKYGEEIKMEQKRAKKLQQQARESKRKSRMRRWKNMANTAEEILLTIGARNNAF